MCSGSDQGSIREFKVRFSHWVRSGFGKVFFGFVLIRLGLSSALGSL